MAVAAAAAAVVAVAAAAAAVVAAAAAVAAVALTLKSASRDSQKLACCTQFTIKITIELFIENFRLRRRWLWLDADSCGPGFSRVGSTVIPILNVVAS